jgi:hypothetical protein
MTSLLETYFFPRGHGLVDARGKVLQESQIGLVAIPVEARWRFEHEFTLYLNDQIKFRKGGDHHLTKFYRSHIRLFTRMLHKGTPRGAVLVALHEMTHMMFAMIQRLERWHGTIGAKGAARLLSQQPWRLLDLSGFGPHRVRLERHVRDLLRILPIPMQEGELAASLVKEAFAYMFGEIVDEAMARSAHAKMGKRGPAVLVSAGFPPKEFIRSYVLEHGFAVTEKQLDSREAQQIFARMTNDVDALAAALRAHLDS